MVDIFIPGDDNRSSTDRKFEPLAIARRIKETVEEDGPERFIVSEESVGRMEFERLFSGSYKITFGFHESNVDHEFTFEPSKSPVSGGSTIQGTPLRKLGGRTGMMARQLSEMGARDFEFVSLEAASHGHTNLTDYEFEYESDISTSDIKESDL